MKFLALTALLLSSLSLSAFGSEPSDLSLSKSATSASTNVVSAQ